MTRYTYVLPLPPSVNHMYHETPKGKALTKEARAFRTEVESIISGRPRFRPRLDRCYSVMSWFTVPTWQHDIDNRVKALHDAVFGTRFDHRIVAAHQRKRVRPGEEPRCTVRIVELPPTWEG